MTIPAARFLVRGRVQGVGFRAFARRTAEQLGLRGFARNLPDGSVETIVSGGADAIESYAGHLRQGPWLAMVTSVDRSDVSVEMSLPNHFVIM